MLFVLSIISAINLLVKAQVSAPSEYIIGEPLNLTWNANEINDSSVNIWLAYYRNNSIYNLTLSPNVTNNGSASLSFNYSNTLYQFNVPHNTNGTFHVGNHNFSISTSNYSFIYQSLYFEIIQGAVYSTKLPHNQSIVVYGRKSIIDNLYDNGKNTITLQGSYVKVYHDGDSHTWEFQTNLSSSTVIDTPFNTTTTTTSTTTTSTSTTTTSTTSTTTSTSTTTTTPAPTLVIAYHRRLLTEAPNTSPTTFPTKTPTTFPTKTPTTFPTKSPTTFPTKIPTSVPTHFPTTIPSKAPTPPTALPSIVPTNPPTPIPTTIPTSVPTLDPTPSPSSHPSTLPTSAPTHVPTDYPTSNPTHLPTFNPTHLPTFNPTLSPTLSPTLGPTLSPTLNPTSVPTIRPTPSPTPSPVSAPTQSPTYAPTDYYVFTVTVTVVDSYFDPAGPFALSVAILSNDEQTDYYTINGASSMNGNELAIYDTANQYVIYDPNDINLTLYTTDQNQPIDNFTYYENIKYKFDISEGLNSLSLYVIMRSTDGSIVYATSCAPWSVSDLKNTSISKFGWKLQEDNGESIINVTSGVYNFSLIWATTSNFVELFSDVSNYEFLHLDNFPQVQVYDNFNISDTNASVYYPPVSISSSNDDNGLTANVDNSNTWTFTSSFPVGTMFYYSFQQNDINYASNNYTLNFTNETGTELQFNTPAGLQDMDNTTVTVTTVLCDGYTLVNTTINVTTTSNGSSSNSLSAGAIVGIVVAGVVVIGVAAWWLCMRRKRDDPKSYKPLEE